MITSLAQRDRGFDLAEHSIAHAVRSSPRSPGRGLFCPAPLLMAALFLLLPISRAAAQSASTGIVQGTVLDDATGLPIATVNVFLEETPYGSLTNADGFYLIRNIPAGEHVIRFSYVGYRTVRMEKVAVLPGLRTVVDVRLEPTPLDLPAIVVTADRPLVQKDVTGSVHRIGSVAIQRLPVNTIQEMVELQPGVTAGGHIRGGRAEETLYVMDGVPVQDPTTGSAAIGLPRSAITELNVHTGGFDAEIGNALSGVVHIVTRRGGNSAEGLLRYDRDDLGAPFGGTEHSGRAQAEALWSGPIRKDRVFYLLAADLVTDGTRWWQDFDEFPIKAPYRKEWNVFGRSDLYLSGVLRITGEALTSSTRERGYEWRWRFNLPGLPATWRDSQRYTLTVNHLLSPTLFYDLQFSTLRIANGVNENDRTTLDGRPLWQYDQYLQYVEGGERLWWYRGRQVINTTRGSVTAQMGAHLLKAGFDISFHQLSSDLLKVEPQTTIYGLPLPNETPLDYTTDYRYFPRTGAFFVQDTYETGDGIVLKAGIRYDWLDPRAQRPVVEWVPTTATEFEQQITAWVPSRRKSQISPRVGFAIPIDESTYFLFNYGLFFQVPLFDQLYSGLNLDLTRGLRVLVGNPDLDHQRTKAYEFSFRRALDERNVGVFTYFFKESLHLVDTKTFLASDSRALEDGFTQYVNMPLARSSGVEISWERRPAQDSPGLRVSYAYMVARGQADTGLSGLNYLQWGFEPDRMMHYLSWDQRHTLTTEVDGRSHGLDYHLVGRYSSPRPYTYAPSSGGLLPEGSVLIPNNARMQENVQIDMRISRDWTVRAAGRELQFNFFTDVRNVTDSRNVLWMSSDGRVGGELGDPGALSMGRRTHVGLEVRF
jgi:hypothetical protein